MTNAEKYKGRPKEAAKAFEAWCKRQAPDCTTCKHLNPERDCKFDWMDREAEPEEANRTCTECGQGSLELILRNGTTIGMAWFGSCNHCGHRTGYYKTREEARAAWNRIAPSSVSIERKARAFDAIAEIITVHNGAFGKADALRLCGQIMQIVNDHVQSSERCLRCRKYLDCMEAEEIGLVGCDAFVEMSSRKHRKETV